MPDGEIQTFVYPQTLFFKMHITIKWGDTLLSSFWHDHKAHRLGTL